MWVLGIYTPFSQPEEPGSPPRKGPTLEVCGLCCSAPCSTPRCPHTPLPWDSPGPHPPSLQALQGAQREATPLKSHSPQRTGHHCSRGSQLPPTWGNLWGHELAHLKGAIPGPGPIGPKVLYNPLTAPRKGVGPEGRPQPPQPPPFGTQVGPRQGWPGPAPAAPAQPAQWPKGFPASCMAFSRLFRCEKG